MQAYSFYITLSLMEFNRMEFRFLLSLVVGLDQKNSCGDQQT